MIEIEVDLREVKEGKLHLQCPRCTAPRGTIFWRGFPKHQRVSIACTCATAIGAREGTGLEPEGVPHE